MTVTGLSSMFSYAITGPYRQRPIIARNFSLISIIMHKLIVNILRLNIWKKVIKYLDGKKNIVHQCKIYRGPFGRKA